LPAFADPQATVASLKAQALPCLNLPADSVKAAQMVQCPWAAAWPVVAQD
jgi:hypothetical protein